MLMRRPPAISLDPIGLRTEFAGGACAPVPEYLAALMRQLDGDRNEHSGVGVNMEQAQQNRRAVLIVEDDA
jgi:hypothetical protein